MKLSRILLFLISAIFLTSCDDPEKINARKATDPKPTPPFEIKPTVGLECDCYNPPEEVGVSDMVIRNNTNQASTGITYYQKTVARDGSNNSSLELISRPIPAKGSTSIGCNVPFIEDQAGNKSCRFERTFSLSPFLDNYDKNPKLVNFKPGHTPITLSNSDFICPRLCSENSSECTSINLPSKQLEAVEATLTLILGDEASKAIGMDEFSDTSKIKTSACDRSSITINNGLYSNFSEDLSSCIVDVNTSIDKLGFEAPARLTAKLLSSEANTKTIWFSEDQEALKMTHQIKPSIFNGKVEFISRDNGKLIFLVNKGTSKQCISLR